MGEPLAILPQTVAEWQAAVAAGADPAIYAQDEEFAQWMPGASYRSQWYVFNDHSPALMACGINGQYLFVDREADLVIVKQSSLPEAVSLFDPYTVRALRALARIFMGCVEITKIPAEGFLPFGPALDA